METIKDIAGKIYEICLDVDNNITGLSGEDSRLWAEANSVRHAHTISAVLGFVEKTGRNKLRVLNASGLACGHQDFSIMHYLKNQKKLDVEWVAYDSPDNPHLEKELFKRYRDDLDIVINLSDFSAEKPEKLYGEEENTYDVVLFTEIAEHLDHSTLLRALGAIRKRITDDGILIVTTPNLVSLPNRFRMLRGRTDAIYDGDGTENMEKGTYGHIVLYDPGRLSKLLMDVGFKIDEMYTFTFGHGPKEKESGMKFKIKLNDLLSNFFKNSRTNIFIVASKAVAERIPQEP